MRLAPTLLLRVRGGAGQIVRFGVVGAIGFCVDETILQVLIRIGGLDPVAARFGSFGCAVVVTFELNRRWAFATAAPEPRLRRFVRYIGVQGIGFACNLAIYTGCYLLLPVPFNDPSLALVIASAVALVVNFFGARLVVFRQRAA